MPQNLTLHNAIAQHCNQSMNNALSAERFPLWQRACPELTDVDFIALHQSGGQWSPFPADK